MRSIDDSRGQTDSFNSVLLSRGNFEHKLCHYFSNMKGKAVNRIQPEASITRRRSGRSIFESRRTPFRELGNSNCVECVFTPLFKTGLCYCLFFSAVFISGGLSALRPSLTASAKETHEVFSFGEITGAHVASFCGSKELRLIRESLLNVKYLKLYRGRSFSLVFAFVQEPF